MNEQACAFVCWILSMICAILSWHAARANDWACMVVTMVFAGIVCLLSVFVLAYKYL